MKTSRPLRSAVFAATLAFAAAAVAKGGPPADSSKVFEDHFRKGEVEAVAAMYAEDGMMLPPNHAGVQGRAAIAAFAKEMTDAGFSLKITPTSDWAEGALAARSGSFIVLDKDQKEVDHGKWVEVWRRGADGKWLMVRDIWNSDVPPPPPPADAKPAENG